MHNGHDHHVVIIGGGMGGLASAVELSVAGLRVTLLEQGPKVGGKCQQISVNGVGVDTGPTVFTMRWILDPLFEKAGTTLQQELSIHRADILARHAWSADERLDLFANRERSADAIRTFSNAAEADRFLKFCDQAQTTYRTLEKAYIRSERPSLWSMNADLGLSGLKVLWDLGMFQSLWQSLSRHFKDPRLHQLFSRYATYCGSSPLVAPATLMLIADVEMQGVWVIDGGMTALAQSLAGLAKRHGAEIRVNEKCDRILTQDDRVCGVQLSSGEIVPADSVVFNGDVAALTTGQVLVGSSSSTGLPPSNPNERSLSALTLSMHAKTEHSPLVHHNLFFYQDYASEFDDIFQHRRLPTKPTIYICAQDRRDDDHLRDTPERLLMLINAPATGDTHTFTVEETSRCLDSAFSLMQRCGLDIHRTESNTVMTSPNQFHQWFPATGGALYGRATHGWMSAFARPGATSKIRGLYLAGGSVHPGPGVPMATMSGRLAAATLMGHLGLIKSSGRVVISGGMSTPSVMTTPMA